MADSKITELTELTTVESSDLIAVVDDPNGSPITKKATVSNITASKAPLASPTFTGTVTLPKTVEIQDTSADHQYVLAVSELTADRTVTLPLLTGNDEVVFKDHTQTLTNKTLTSPKINEDVALTATATQLNTATNAWTAFTPSWTNLTVGSGGTNSGYYCQIGKTVHLRVKVILGTSPSVGAVDLTLPVAASSNYIEQQPIGNVVLRDTDGGIYVLGRLGRNGNLYYSKVSSTVSILWNLGSSEPFTWAASDEIMITATYEAA